MTAAVTQTLCVPLTAELAVQVMDFVDSCLTGLGCAVSPRQANRLRIAVDEVSSNLLSYSSARQVTCQFSMQNGRIVLSFCDDGIPYDPLTQAEPDTSAPAEERALGGLGLLLVKRLMNDVRYQYRDAQNVLTLYLLPE